MEGIIYSSRSAAHWRSRSENFDAKPGIQNGSDEEETPVTQKKFFHVMECTPVVF